MHLAAGNGQSVVIRSLLQLNVYMAYIFLLIYRSLPSTLRSPAQSNEWNADSLTHPSAIHNVAYKRCDKLFFTHNFLNVTIIAI